METRSGFKLSIYARVVLFFLLVAPFSIASSLAQSEHDDKGPRSKVTRQGSLAVKQLVTPDSVWDQLSLRRKLFVYYLTEAIESGRDIIWLQASPEGLAIRELLESLWGYRTLYKAVDRAALEEFLTRLYSHHGNYNAGAGEKFIPESLRYNQLVEMIEIAERAASNNDKKLELKAEAQRLSRHIFDPEYLKEFKAEDLSKAAPQFYRGISDRKELVKAEKAYRSVIAGKTTANPFLLTYPIRGPNGEIVMELARIGGRFSKQLQVIDHFLALAVKHGKPAEKAIIEAHRKTLRTGNYEDALSADRLWVQYQPEDVDFVVGFIESYLDPLDRRGAWEGFVFLKKLDPVTTARVDATRKNALYFENQMPVDPAYRKSGKFTPPQSESSYLLFAGGDNGESPFLGVNLPNDNEIREKFGSKSATAYNVMTDLVGEGIEKERKKTSPFHSKEGNRLIRSVDLQLAADVQVEFHEVLGHGSGKLLAGVSENDLGIYYSPIEEGRAELASLYHITDPKLQEFGILPKSWTSEQVEDFVKYSIVRFFSNQLRSYVRLSDDTKEIRQAHQWARQAMMHYLLDKGAIEIKLSEDGIPQVSLNGIAKTRKILGDMWAEIQDLKSRRQSADAKEKAALAFLKKWGQYTDEHREWRLAIKEVSRKENLPTHNIFLNPKMKLVLGENQRPKDVRLVFEEGGQEGLSVVVNRQHEMSKANHARCDAVFSAAN